MNNNPLLDVAERVKQQRLDSEISSIKKDIKSIMEKNDSVKLIELQIYQEVGSSDIIRKISINPNCIAFIREDGDHAFISMTNEVLLHTVESREDILKLITPEKSYIG